MHFTVSDWPTYLIILGMVVACALLPYVSKVSEWFVTIVHEFGHGITALAFLGGIHGIKLHGDGSGVTQTTIRAGFFSKLTHRIVLFAGYSFPVYLGVALILTVMSGNTVFGSIVLALMGVLTFVFLRNWFGFVIVFLYLGTLLAFWMMRETFDQKYIILFMGMLFLIRGLYDIIMTGRMVFNKASEAETDFHLLAATSWFPATVWYVIYILIQTAIVFGILNIWSISFSIE